ncbi:DoxX family protein [Gordonia sp. HNM0687]|uniref:DoxX family protein n=1 Tax=Gordonia mangrovi TaxID=2665643 RepID=A0A6L7GR78_9ACTN|nr:DoxX family protein [Gordonia mangrovi]MXP21867.1 DoxX family protein [Gordonia mangrovi]UVF76238.1 DoxX family protein [Gordonia mangrovi]
MTTTSDITDTSTDVQSGTRNWRHTTGVVISVLLGAFLVFDVFGKLTRPEAVVEGTAELGFPIDQTYVMGTVLLICLVVWAIPRTAVLGAVGLTAYLGGAVTANMRIESPLLDHTLFPVYFGVLIWVGLVLRRPELLKVAGIRR